MSENQPLVNTDDFSQSPFEQAIFALLRPGVERLLRIKKLNNIYDQVRGRTQNPDEFAREILKLLNVDYKLPEKEINALKEIKGPLVIVSNFPFGGVEALIMVRVLSQITENFKLVANNMLGKISELQDSIIVVDPFYGEKIQAASGKTNSAAVKSELSGPLGKQLVRYLQNDGVLGIFPAAQTSSFNFEQGRLKDAAWDQNIARIIKIAKATVVPVYFHGKASFLTRMARWISPKLGERLWAREMTRPGGQKIRFQIGKKILPSRLVSFPTPDLLTKYLRSKTYFLSANYLRGKFSVRKMPYEPPKVEMEIIAPIDSQMIQAEVSGLPQEQILVDREQFKLFYFIRYQAPRLMREIGRLREITFRGVGEGSGLDCDIDRFDEYYLQLVLWDKDLNQVAGGYRIGRIDEILATRGLDAVYVNSLFKINPHLFDQIGHSLEMGRSYIVPEYQKSYAPLMLLWTGIGEYVSRNPDYKILIGPVSITAELNDISRTMLVAFLEENNMNTEFQSLAKPRNKFRSRGEIIRNYYNTFAVKDLKDVQELISEVNHSNHGVPILLKHYLKLGGSLLAFNVDPDFSNVVDGLIMVDLTKTEPHILAKYMGKEGVEAFLAQHHQAN